MEGTSENHGEQGKDSSHNPAPAIEGEVDTDRGRQGLRDRSDVDTADDPADRGTVQDDGP